MQQYKSLEDLGVKREYCYLNWFNTLKRDRRSKEWKQERKEYGIDSRSTWNWSEDFMDYIYIHLEMFNRVNIVDFNNEYETIIFEGHERTIQSAIDEILDWFRERYYPNKDETISISDYKSVDMWREDLVNWSEEKHRIILLFAEIIEHLNW